MTIFDNRTSAKLALLWPALAALLFCVGCGSGGGTFVPVSGQILMDGKPLANVIVTFQPISGGVIGEMPPASRGKTDAQGRYSLKRIDGGSLGAMVGKHVVTISDVEINFDPSKDEPVIVKSNIPERYRLNSELSFEVKPGAGHTDADFKLISK